MRCAYCALLPRLHRSNFLASSVVRIKRQQNPEIPRPQTNAALGFAKQLNPGYEAGRQSAMGPHFKLSPACYSFSNNFPGRQS